MKQNEIKTLINIIKEELLKNPKMKKVDEATLNSAVMDTLFEGFMKGELHRSDLAIAADMLGFKLNEEFMNDPHPDPIDLKKGGR